MPDRPPDDVRRFDELPEMLTPEEIEDLRRDSIRGVEEGREYLRKEKEAGRKRLEPKQ